jgi:hypothetical protein
LIFFFIVQEYIVIAKICLAKFCFVSMSSEFLQIKKNENVSLTESGNQGEGWTTEKGSHQLMERGGGGWSTGGSYVPSLWL